MKKIALSLVSIIFMALFAMPVSATSSSRTKFAACAHGWAQYKVANNVKGRAAYKAYMEACLKPPTPAPTPAPSSK